MAPCWSLADETGSFGHSKLAFGWSLGMIQASKLGNIHQNHKTYSTISIQKHTHNSTSKLKTSIPGPSKRISWDTSGIPTGPLSQTLKTRPFSMEALGISLQPCQSLNIKAPFKAPGVSPSPSDNTGGSLANVPPGRPAAWEVHSVARRYLAKHGKLHRHGKLLAKPGHQGFKEVPGAPQKRSRWKTCSDPSFYTFLEVKKDFKTC